MQWCESIAQCSFAINAANAKRSNTYISERNQYYTFRVSRFQEIACEIHSHLAREVKMNLKQRFGMFAKKEKFHPRWDSNPQPLN